MVTALCNSKLGGLYTIFTPLCTLCEDKQLTPSELMSHHWWEECSADKGFVNAQVCFCSVRLLGPGHEIQTHPDAWVPRVIVTHWEKQCGEQEAAWSQPVGKAEHWGKRERIWNLTSSQLDSISATGKQAPSLRDENAETVGPGRCCIRGRVHSYSIQSEQRQPCFTSQAAETHPKRMSEWMQWDQVLDSPEKEILTITGNFALSGLTAPMLLQMAQQHLSTTTSIFATF